jgi:hypothetical protein
MAISRKPLDVDNYSALDGGTGTAIPGYYSRVNLNDIINNFIVGYTGDGKVLPKIPRYDVAFWAQRAVQEFSYDVFHAEKNIEIELSSTLQISLPSDYVNYIDLSCVDKNGSLKPIQNNKFTDQKTNINGTYVLDLEAGKIYFDSYFTEGDLIVLKYISDGLGDNGDFTNVLVPKLAEDAIYSTILYNISKLRPTAAGAAPLYKKEAAAKMRNAKIRLSNMKVKEIAQVLRGKSKWIKH